MFRVDDRFRQFLTYAAIGVLNTGIHWLLLRVWFLVSELIQFVGIFDCSNVLLRHERKIYFSEAKKFCRLHQDDYHYGRYLLGYRLVRRSKQLVSSFHPSSFICDQPGVGFCFNESVCFSLKPFRVCFFIAK